MSRFRNYSPEHSTLTLLCTLKHLIRCLHRINPPPRETRCQPCSMPSPLTIKLILNMASQLSLLTASTKSCIPVHLGNDACLPAMGIPRFAYRMRDYAHTEVIGTQNTEKNHTEECARRAIIDGPSLAHFIFHSSTHGQRINQDIISECDYAETGRLAIAWLDLLCSNGFDM